MFSFLLVIGSFILLSVAAILALLSGLQKRPSKKLHTAYLWVGSVSAISYWIGVDLIMLSKQASTLFLQELNTLALLMLLTAVSYPLLKDSKKKISLWPHYFLLGLTAAMAFVMHLKWSGIL